MNKTYEMWLELLGEKSRIEEVKKILEANDSVVIEGDIENIRGITEDSYNKVARQIYQLVKEWVNDLA